MIWYQRRDVYGRDEGTDEVVGRRPTGVDLSWPGGLVLAIRGHWLRRGAYHQCNVCVVLLAGWTEQLSISSLGIGIHDVGDNTMRSQALTVRATHGRCGGAVVRSAYGRVPWYVANTHQHAIMLLPTLGKFLVLKHPRYPGVK